MSSGSIIHKFGIGNISILERYRYTILLDPIEFQQQRQRQQQ
jgi:hypothetical protein